MLEEMSPNLLTAENLQRKFGEFVAVRNVSFQLQAGKIVGLLGPNGAGKSTTMRMLAGLLEPDRGSITLGGFSLAAQPLEAKKLLGFLADEPMIMPYLTGFEYIQFVAGLYGIPGGQIEERAEPLLKRFNLVEAIHRRADGYSHGMQQKLALVAQLVHEPRLLLADEPTVGLDPASTIEMHSVFRDYCAKGNTILLSTHLLSMAQELCDRVLIMAQGQVVYEGDPRVQSDSEESLERRFLRLTGEDMNSVTTKAGVRR